ncbi:MAG: hypothetical protein ACRDBO_14225 [Lachnospiraceae bacterium]
MKHHIVLNTIQIEMIGEALICENHTIQSDHITRVWMGTAPVPGFHLIKKKTGKGVHIECCSGTIYSFIAEDDELIAVAYAMLSNSLMKVDELLELQEDKEDQNKVSVQAEKAESVIIYAYSEIEDELVKLNTYLEGNEPGKPELLMFVQQAIEKNRQADKEGLKPVFREFITNGIISICNELGLFHLIEAIKSVFI